MELDDLFVDIHFKAGEKSLCKCKKTNLKELSFFPKLGQESPY